MSAINITPGYQFNNEVITDAKLNELGSPTGSVPAGSITTAELSAGVNAALAAVTSAIAAVVTQNTSFVVSSGDKGKLFFVTTAGSNVTATLPAAASGWYAWFAKADVAGGIVLTSPSLIGLSKQNQLVLVWSDGANYFQAVFPFNSDASGNLLLLGKFIKLFGTDATAPAFKINGTTIAHRLADDSADAPITAAGAIFSGPVSNNAYFPLGNLTGAAAAVDASKANRFWGTLTGNVTGLTISNMTEGQPVIIELVQDGTGGRTVAWTGITWQGGSTPTQTSTASKADIYCFEKRGAVIKGTQQPNF